MKYDQEIERLKTVKAKYEQDLLKRANVVGVGIGFKYENGRPTNEVVLVVNVTEKRSVAELAPEDVIPAQLDGVPVDVQEVGQVKAL